MLRSSKIYVNNFYSLNSDYELATGTTNTTINQSIVSSNRTKQSCDCNKHYHSPDREFANLLGDNGNRSFRLVTLGTTGSVDSFEYQIQDIPNRAYAELKTNYPRHSPLLSCSSSCNHLTILIFSSIVTVQYISKTFLCGQYCLFSGCNNKTIVNPT